MEKATFCCGTDAEKDSASGGFVAAHVTTMGADGQTPWGILLRDDEAV
ncbi:hypothetical protein HHL08_02125 [Sphingobium sp. AR-3-1]|uniref:Uncharacterized protein n=1 Tax=Sphingobium psychrophilum TaxID=2728834 RepID=A0A7X9ZRW9_9SPHN|nr:hypothetical protein [Sphingobium psychrophilum]NML08951.1 hypothetical protein [Sphingobium psychrophilum]